MPEKVRENKIETLRKLQKITVENGASEAEALNAAAKMQEILQLLKLENHFI